jgi:transcriptional regulator with XRE-family HTH domain
MPKRPQPAPPADLNPVRAVRRRRGWSVAQLAAAMGVSPRTVEGWEQGKPMGGSAARLLATL